MYDTTEHALRGINHDTKTSAEIARPRSGAATGAASGGIAPNSLASEIAGAALGGIKAQRSIVDRHNREALEQTPVGKPKPKPASGTDDLRGDDGIEALQAVAAAQRKIDAIASDAKKAARTGMAVAMSTEAQRIVDGWATREPGEDEVTAFAEAYGSNLQAARAANAQFERIGSNVRVRHRLDAMAGAIDEAASRAKAVTARAASGSEFTAAYASTLEQDVSNILTRGEISGDFEFGTAEPNGLFNQMLRASRGGNVDS